MIARRQSRCRDERLVKVATRGSLVIAGVQARCVHHVARRRM